MYCCNVICGALTTSLRDWEEMSVNSAAEKSRQKIWVFKQFCYYFWLYNKCFVWFKLAIWLRTQNQLLSSMSFFYNVFGYIIRRNLLSVIFGLVNYTKTCFRLFSAVDVRQFSQYRNMEIENLDISWKHSFEINTICKSQVEITTEMVWSYQLMGHKMVRFVVKVVTFLYLTMLLNFAWC